MFKLLFGKLQKKKITQQNIGPDLVTAQVRIIKAVS